LDGVLDVRVLNGVRAAIVAIFAQVTIGWLLQDVNILRIRPTWPVMQLGSALSLICLAVATASVAFGRRRLAAILSVPPFALAAATIVEFLNGLPFGLHYFLLRVPFLTERLTPAALSQGTAIAFVFASIVVWLLVQRHQQPTLIAIVAGIPLVIGSVALFAHTLAVDAIHTSIRCSWSRSTPPQAAHY
jgi:hypothetical protein